MQRPGQVYQSALSHVHGSNQGDIPSTKVLDGVFERNGFSDRNTVLGDLGSTKSLAYQVSFFLANSHSMYVPIITVLPLGPRVALTAFARISTPLNIPCLASFPKITSFDAYPRIELAKRAGRGRADRDRRKFIVVSCM
jgi:hypothetical protein